MRSKASAAYSFNWSQNTIDASPYVVICLPLPIQDEWQSALRDECDLHDQTCIHASGILALESIVTAMLCECLAIVTHCVCAQHDLTWLDRHQNPDLQVACIAIE